MVELTKGPPKLLVLPHDSSPDARICTLAHPRTAIPSRYYFCPKNGLYEFTKIAPQKGTYQSWLITPERYRSVVPSVAGADSHTPSLASRPSEGKISYGTTTQNKPSSSMSEGYVVQSPELLMATPIDPLFLALPAFYHPATSTKPVALKTLFLSADDLLEILFVQSEHLNSLWHNDNFNQKMQRRIAAICDTVEAGDETMYRLNLNKLLNELLAKVRKMVSSGLPPTLEEQYVQKPLEAPIVIHSEGESSSSDPVKMSREHMVGSESVSTSTDGSQSSRITEETIMTQDSVCTTITTPDAIAPMPVSTEIVHLQRLRIAFSYITFAYVPQALESFLQTLFKDPDSPVNFAPLDEHLAHLAALRADALALRSLSDFSRKRGNCEDDETVELRAEKRQKKEEEEKRKKAGESRGVRDLRKVDVSGMKKMSEFFGARKEIGKGM